MKKITLLALAVLFSALLKAQPFGASNFTLISQSSPETTTGTGGKKYSACWGWYQATKNKEYAIACSHKGTYWVDVTVPATPTVSAYRAGPLSNCIWREAKSYKNYLYVISDDNGNNRFQIFDMKYLPDSVHTVYDGTTLFERAHALWVDGDRLYISSVTSGTNHSTMNVYSLANPELPVLLRRLDQDYPFVNSVHDMFIRRDTVYASCAFQGLYVFKLLSNNTFSQLGSLTSYPGSGYNHSSALTPNGQTLVFLDEVPAGLPIKVANVSNLSNIQVLATTNQYTQTTPHNPFIVNNQYCFISAYQDGLQLYNISNPAAPVLAGYFDTYPAFGGNNNIYPTNGDYNGQWGCYPFFPSGNIFCLDQSNGVFMLKTALYQAPPVSPEFSLPVKACAGSAVNLMSNSSGANSFTWSVPTGASITTTLGSASVTFTAAGVYSITLAASNQSFSSNVTNTILISNITTAVSSTNASNNGSTDGKASVVPSGGTAPYTYSWVPYGGTAATAINLQGPGCYTVTIKDAFGCVAKPAICVGFNSTVGFGAIIGDQRLNIYPNPAQTFLNIELTGTIFDYAIYNVDGRLLTAQKHNTDNCQVKLDTFSKGVYIVEISIGNDIIKKQLVIE